MVRSESRTVLAALGFSPSVERVYERVQRRSGQRLDLVATALSTTPATLTEDLAPLLDRGIVRIRDGLIEVESPTEALARLIVVHSDAASRSHADLAALARAVPLLVAGTARPGEGDVEDVRPIDGEVSTGGDARRLIAAMLVQSEGDLCWLRPDQWRAGREGPLLAAIRDLTASGRRSRAIYPVRILREAPEVVQARAGAGEEVRLLPDLPTRMFLIGRTHAVLPEPLGFVDEPRTLIRQQGVVEALLLYFELLWDRATPVPGLEDAPTRGELRRFLLEQLAAGEHDEQIARRLDLSLRTVRRRVADLMTELGADSRFQAGVEAARRGWI